MAAGVTLFQPIPHWRLLTPLNIHTRRAWPWGHSIQKIVSASRPQTFRADEVLIASDYSGEHDKATHLIYCYLVVEGNTRAWYNDMQRLRKRLLIDGRRMAYKRLSDPLRQQALIPFLTAAGTLKGHLIAIAVDKRKKWLSIPKDSADEFAEAFKLSAKWNPRALEGMARKIQLFCIILSLWSRPYSSVSWITDQDDFVANDKRHDDALSMAARMTGFYIPYPMRKLALATTAQDDESRGYEDLCAIPDLAGGMLADILSGLSKLGSWQKTGRKELTEEIRVKTDIICDWFWDPGMPLGKTLIALDVEGDKYGIRKIDRQLLF